MIPTSAPWASQTGKAPMLSALSRVQMDVIEFFGNARRQRLPVGFQDVRNPHGEPPLEGLDLPHARAQSVAGVGLKQGRPRWDGSRALDHEPGLRHRSASSIIRRWVRSLREDLLVMIVKVRNSLKSLRNRHRDNRLVRRKGRVYIINKTQRRYKARQG